MNTLFGSSFGFISPFLLGAFPVALGVLVYAYRRRGRGERVSVSTVLILRSLSRPSLSRRRFVPPLRFFFELLLVSLLALGAAGLFLESDGEQVALVLDNSFSMSAARDNGDRSQNVFDEARQQADRLLASFSGSGKVNVFVTAPVFRSVTNGVVTVGKAQKALETVETVFAPDALSIGLQRLTKDTHYKKVYVLSDKVRADSLDDSEEAQSVRFLTVSGTGPNRSNIAVSDISLRRSDIESGDESLEVSIAGFTTTQTLVTVSVEGLNSDSSEWAPVSEKQITLPAGSTQTATFSKLNKEIAVYRVALKTAEAETKDLLKGDNIAYFGRESKKPGLLLVGPLSPEAVGLNKLRFVTTSYLAADHYLPEAPEVKGADLVLFHRYNPETLPRGNALYIMPPRDAGTLKSLPAVKDAQVTRWLSSHPVLSYLSLAGLKFPELTPLVLPDWSKEGVSTTAGAALYFGEVGDGRRIVSGFELLPYEGKSSPILSILLLNSLKWLSSASLSQGFSHPFSPIPVEEAGAYNYISEPARLDPACISELALGSAACPGVLSNAAEGLLAISFMNPQESDLRTVQQIGLPTEVASAESTQRDRRLLSSLVAAVLMLLMLLDIILRWSRRTRRRQVSVAV